MLRRRIVLPVLSSAGLQAVEASKRHTRQSGGFQQFSYLPPGNHAPRMPWLRDAVPPASTIKMAAYDDAAPSHADPADLEGILRAPRNSSDPVAAALARAAAESAGPLQTTAAKGGPLRTTAACRMPALAEPNLDTRIGDILKVSDSLAGEMLPDVVRLLIEPSADGVENVSLSDFAAMQPKRQLAALAGRKQWHEWLIESAHYKQVARLELESPYYDLRALRQAGVTTLYQWAEQPELVKVSSYTRSLLDAAVEKSVEAYVEEVVKVVNTSNRLSEALVSWAADTVSSFVLESLRMTVEQAASQRQATGLGNSVVGTENTNETIAEEPAIAAMGTTAASARPGHVCTLEHYHQLARKVLASVRKEYMAQRHADYGGNAAGKTLPDGQAEAEIREKAYATLNEAILKVLESQAHNMPKELHALRDHGFLALERIPGLLRQAASVLQLRNVPVRYFVFHSTGEQEKDELERHDLEVSAPGGADAPLPGTAPTSSMNVAAPTLTNGIFLAGIDNYNVKLGEWPGHPQPSPAAASAAWPGDTVQNEYFSLLHRLKRHTTRVARTTLFEIIKGADEFRNGFNAAESLGLQQLFGTAKLVEERLSSVLNCCSTPPSIAKPVHFVEAGYSCGKTAVLERLSRRMSEAGKKAVIVRYTGATMPFTPGLDDHPLAFSSRFWFRVALASCPYLIRTEELFTRAPKSVMWWANRLNWSWELYQKRIRLYGNCEGTPSLLHAVLVDDMDRVLDAMETRLVAAATVSTTGMLNGVPSLTSQAGYAAGAEAAEADVLTTTATVLRSVNHSNLGKAHSHDKDSKTKKEDASAVSLASMLHLRHYTPFHVDAVEAALAKVTVAVGQLDVVFTGHRASRLLLTHADTPVRRYFIPLSNGIGLQQRLRVLPLVSVLYALHQRSRLEFSGLMYEVLKNCPGLLGYTLDVFWSGQAALMDLRGGAPRLMQWSGTHPLLRSYVPTELFAELPQRNYLLQNLPEARLRLVELLQRQLSSPTGFLTTGVDTTVQDERDGFVVPYNHTTCQVHPFALFTIFTYQDMLESPRETMVVRAWGEVWAEYCAVVSAMGTTTERKRDALRVLLHGALLLRVVAVSGAQMDLNMKIPPYGFPLLASPTRVKQRGGAEPVAVKATPDTVRKAAAAYKAFFSQTEQTHIPFRPSVGLNGGCDVVCIAGTTLALYDLVTTPEALQGIGYRFAEALLGVLHCLGKNVLPHNKVRQIHYVSVVSIDQTMLASPHGGKLTLAGGAAAPTAVDDVFAAPPSPVVPYLLDLSAVFEDDVIDRLRALQETLGIGKEFRTLNDLLDELESAHQVTVHQDVVASQEELESLLSTTLTQLVPDATVLPAYTAEVVSPDTLLMDLLVDEEEESFRGAEVEEVRSDAVLAKEAATPESYADAEHVQESAELLEALLNDSLTELRPLTAVERATNDTAQAALLTDMATEDAINNNIAVTAEFMGGRRAAASTTPAPAQEDALAWLHDIVTPAAAAADGREGGPGQGRVTVTTTLSGNPPPPHAAGGGAFVSLDAEEEEEGDDDGDEGDGGEEAEEVEEDEGEAGTHAGQAAQPKRSRKTPSHGGGGSRQRSRQPRPRSQRAKSKQQKKPTASVSAGRKRPGSKHSSTAAAVAAAAKRRGGTSKTRTSRTAASSPAPSAAAGGGKKRRRK
ncbi:uncharacterized protein Tco025E_06717 [Trypanosoma conorhini]|uniref:Uncharacterized protein n=1 Tax=Trypanosoma conorhini TaxID=83891 RepID=A0A3R7KP96_9TRYP|nr:uncharacterized protein Tco025E_06717 [Trypanosoma conorhini]RNF10918.1 hypothetical protein Tco025E_06717 [Trypanosoma conorhini]